MQSLLDKSVVPPDGFRSLQPETKMWIRGGDYWSWMENAKAHRLANNIPIGPLWEAETEDQPCRMLPPGHCKEQRPDQVAVNVSTRMSFEDVATALNRVKREGQFAKETPPPFREEGF